MARIIIEIDDLQYQRVIDSVALIRGYQDTITDVSGDSIPNPETREQFLKRTLFEFLKEHVIAYESQRDSEIARLAAIDRAKSEIEIIEGRVK